MPENISTQSAEIDLLLGGKKWLILISPRPSLSSVASSLSKPRSFTGDGETKCLMMAAQMSHGIFYNTVLMFFPPGRNYMLTAWNQSPTYSALQSQDAVCKSWNFDRGGLVAHYGNVPTLHDKYA